MYIHIGQNKVVQTKDIVGIFDLDSATIKKTTRNYLTSCEKNGKVCTVSNELPRSFAVCANPGGAAEKVYISPISSVTLLKRKDNFIKR